MVNGSNQPDRSPAELPAAIPLPILGMNGQQSVYNFRPSEDITAFEVSEVWRFFAVASKMQPHIADRVFAGLSQGARGHFHVQRKPRILTPR